MDVIENRIISLLKNDELLSSTEIHQNLSLSISISTLKRILSKLVTNNYLEIIGHRKSSKYKISEIYDLLEPINIDKYFEKEIDERKIKEDFNFSIIRNIISQHKVLTNSELEKLNYLQKTFTMNISQLSDSAYKKEFERLAIDLSWKSSQIEGNTYSLLETELLLKEKLTASGKTKEEAIMLLNHKDAIDFLILNPDYLSPITIPSLEDIHSILIKELGVDRNIRKRRVGITGTNYRPLDNEFQIIEALEQSFKVINNKENVFEKALLALVLISYIQPFNDGNKRTARIVSNALLMNENHCPLSYRSIDPIEYKKGMLLFYEQNNISRIKEIFIEQFEFAVNTYF